MSRRGATADRSVGRLGTKQAPSLRGQSGGSCCSWVSGTVWPVVPPENSIRPENEGQNGSDQQTVGERTLGEHTELSARVSGSPTVIRDHNMPRFTPVLPPFCGPKSERFESCPRYHKQQGDSQLCLPPFLLRFGEMPRNGHLASHLASQWPENVRPTRSCSLPGSNQLGGSSTSRLSFFVRASTITRREASSPGWM